MNITLELLVEAIEDAKTTITVSVPCRDYYARRGDTSEDELTYICPNKLIEFLTNLN